MFWIKAQDKTPDKWVKEVDIGNFPEKEFRIMIAKMMQNLRNWMEKDHEIFTEDLEEPQEKQRWTIHKKESIAE